MRYTLKDVHTQIDNLATTYRAMGWMRDTEVVLVQEGNGTMGHTWSLRIRDESDGYVRAFPGVELSGVFTRKDAYNAIRHAGNMARWAWLAQSDK